jgi:hypothetical protein
MGIYGLVNVVEFDIDGFVDYFASTWEFTLREGGDGGLRAGGEYVERSGHVDHLV